ncbi:MAG TPA: ubiquinol-cytochrome C chaperone family protein [Caulobacteraceae bacterium]|jgi:cytochrome b pre-mRNA-processing protein 3|nr:ubiquinol-cytochrome C chaperone family protein [Caulobacteraceae bacterium]
MIWPRRGEKAARGLGRELCDSAVRQGRAPALYSSLGAPDTVEGRFELLTLHVILLVDVMRDLGAEAAPSSQSLFDAYVRDLDGALREMGVGDLTVGKRMRALGRAFYGRAAAWRAAFMALPDRTEIETLVSRTILAGDGAASPIGLADYAIDCREALAAKGRGLLEGASWPDP